MDDKEKKIRLLKALQAKRYAELDKKIEKIDLSIIQKAYTCAKEKIRILCGANRSGKSHVGGTDTLIRATGIVPECVRDIFPNDLIRFGEYWITSLDFPSSREITQRKIFEICPKRMVQTFNKEFRYIKLTTGSTLGFKSADSGREKFQGTSKIGIWNDEEGPEDVWDEEYMRTTDCRGWLSLTFTPLMGLTWAYKNLYLKAHRYVYTKNIHEIEEGVGVVHTIEEIEKLKERKLVSLPNTSEDCDSDVIVFQMSIYDNKFLPSSEIQKAERKYKNDPLQYNARILGKFTKLTGRSVYNVDVLIRRQASIPSTFKRGELDMSMFKHKPKGRLTLYKDPKNISSGNYVIGADIAEGLETGDFSCAQVLDRRTCEQVAVWHGHISPEEFAVVLYNMGKFFNNAFIGVERNMHGYGVIKKLRDMKYNRLLYDYDESTKVLKKNTKGEKRYGWYTDAKTKPIMVQDLATFINNGHIRLNDFNTIEELLTFNYLKDGDMGAMGGCYDDRVMALCIALQTFKNTPIMSGSTSSSTSKPNIRVSKITGY